MLSEVYYPAWKAYIDGHPAPIYVADHLLRSVPVPAGEHTVKLRYEPQTLRAGMLISIVAYGTLLALALATTRRRLRKTRKGAGGRSTNKPFVREGSIVDGSAPTTQPVPEDVAP